MKLVNCLSPAEFIVAEESCESHCLIMPDGVLRLYFVVFISVLAQATYLRGSVLIYKNNVHELIEKHNSATSKELEVSTQPWNLIYKVRASTSTLKHSLVN